MSHERALAVELFRKSLTIRLTPSTSAAWTGIGTDTKEKMSRIASITRNHFKPYTSLSIQVSLFSVFWDNIVFRPFIPISALIDLEGLLDEQKKRN